MFYLIYKITNDINSKIYIGCHKTANINDDYMGSRMILIRAQKKYGIENFSKEILHIFNDMSKMYNKEKEIVNETFIERVDTYNIKCGGIGGWDHVNKERDWSKTDMSFRTVEWEAARQEAVQTARQQLVDDGFDFGAAFRGGKHTDDAKKKIGAANSKHQNGKGNSQYSTRWIYNPIDGNAKKILKSNDIPPGWLKGRAKKKEYIKVPPETAYDSMRGDKHVNYGKIWVYSVNEKCSRMISSTDVIPTGWEKGRKMSF